jgi:hypothetical protein
VAELAPQYREKVVTFGDNGSLVGVLTIPSDARPDAPHVILLNSGIVHRVGAHRSYVTFARALAKIGVPVLRFDLSGIGDSERQATAVSLQESVLRDISAAADFLSLKQGAKSLVVAGLCSGAFDAFLYALADERVSGAFMLDMPGPFRNWSHLAYRAAGRALRPASWMNLVRRISKQARPLPLVGSIDGAQPGDASTVFLPGVRGHLSRDRMEAELDKLLARGVKLMFVFTGGVEDDYNHRLQFRLRFPRAAAHPSLCTEFIPWSDHTFSTRNAREYVTGYLQNWVAQQAS